MPEKAQTPINGNDFSVISVVGVIHAISHFFQLIFPPLFPWLMVEFSLSFSSVGMLMSIFFFMSGTGQAISGFAVDKFGPRPILIFGLVMFVFSALLLAYAPNIGFLFAAAAVAGIGNSVFHPGDFTILNSKVSTNNIGHAFSVHGLSGTLGWGIAPIFMFAIASWQNWRFAALCAALVAFVGLVIVFLNGTLFDKKDNADKYKEKLQDRDSHAFGFLKSSTVLMCFTFFLFWTLAFSALQNFAATIINNIYNIPLSIATASITAYMIGSALGMIAGGFMLNKANPDRAVAWGLCFAALIALLIASGSPPSITIVPLMVAMGLFSGFAGPSRDMLVRKSAVSGAGPKSYGRIYGFVYSGLDAGLAVSPILFGWLMDSSKFAQVLVGVALFQILAIFTALRVGWRISAPESMA